MKASIMDIKHFAIHDGDGIRTTVFFKGCPLRCVWCHNPEGLAMKSETAYFDDKCISCGECVKTCNRNAHIINNGRHEFIRTKCMACGECERVCPGNALKAYGVKMTADELIPILLEDKAFYDSSGGGVTLSGGECLLQSDFCAELLKKLKEENIHTAVDTCGYVPRESIDKVIPYTDIFLYDIKAIDEDVHIRCTGRSNKQILENIKYIDSQNKAIEVRIPYVPNYNDNQIEKAAEFLARLNNVIRVKILPYHSYVGSKYAALGITNNLPEIMPTDEQIQVAEEIIMQKIGIE